MLRAYFDESGTHGSAVATGIMGFVGPEAEWQSLSEQWTARLAQDDVTVFHAYDCLANKGEYGDFRYWTVGRKDALFGDLGRLISARNLVLLGDWIQAQSWDQFKKRARQRNVANCVPINKYAHCFDYCLNLTAWWCTENQPTEKVDVTFAKHQQYASLSRGIIDRFRRSTASSMISAISFDSPSSNARLQVADFAAFEFYRFQQNVADIRTLAVRPIWFMLEEMAAGQEVHLSTADELTRNYLL